MTVLRTTVRNGKIELAAPVDWPEGTEVRIEPFAQATMVGLSEEDWPDTTEAIAAFLESMDKIEPLILTPEEEAAWETERSKRRDFEKALFEGHARTLQSDWE